MYRAAIITLFDKAARSERKDVSGQVIADMLAQAVYEVVQRLLLSDDRQGLADALIRICDGHEADLILTTGGTGFSIRDNTPEATMDVIERPVPCIAILASDVAECARKDGTTVEQARRTPPVRKSAGLTPPEIFQ